MNERDHIIISNLKYVKNIAYQFKIDSLSHMDYDDLMSIGVIGLINAVMTYDDTKNMKFKNYAQLKIKGSIIDELRKSNYVPKNKYELIKKYFECIQDLKSEGYRNLSKLIISKKMNMSVKEVEKIERNISFINVFSIEEIFSEENDSGIYDIKSDELSPEEHYFKKNEISILKKAINSLNHNERKVICLYYFANMNLKEIGKRMCLTEGRVSQINRKALNNLRNIYKESFDGN